jgi:cytoskeleton protein RodZ
MLEHERTRQGLSIQQAAEGLHLDAWIIEAIETNRFLALGAPVYAKGYLRKYAVLLGLAPDVIVARYDALTDTPIEPTPVPVMTTAPPPRPKWPKYLGWSLLAALVLAIGFVAFEFLWPAPAVTAPPTTTSTVTAPAPTPSSEPTSVPVVAAPASVAEEPSRPVAPVESTPVEARRATPETPSATTPTSAPSGESIRLTLAFSDPSWAEVYDATGKRLFYDIGQAGRARTVEGAAPLNVVIGVAAAVNVQVNDREIVVPRRANRDSARFVVNGDGSVR